MSDSVTYQIETAMKRIVLTLIGAMMGVCMAIAQAPNGFNYQALVYQDGAPVANKSIDLEVTLQDAHGTVYYQEQHNGLKTEETGFVNVAIGEGTVLTGAMDKVDWEKGIFVAVRVNVGSGMVSLGAPVKLQSVPYALFAMATPRVKGTNKNVEQDSPIFEVLNSKGTQVFGVYEGGVRFNVMEDDGTRGPRGGFAVATMRESGMRGEADAINRLMITGPRFDVTVDPVTRGPRGGFAVSSRSFGNAFGTRGTAGTLPLFNVDDQVSYFTQKTSSTSSTSILSFRDRFKVDSVIMNLTTTGEILTHKGATDVLQPLPSDASKMGVQWYPNLINEASRWLLPEVTYDGKLMEYSITVSPRLESRMRAVKVQKTGQTSRIVEGIGLEYYADKLEDLMSPNNTINDAATVCLVDYPTFCRTVTVQISDRKVAEMKLQGEGTFKALVVGQESSPLWLTYFDKAGSEITETDALLANMPFTVSCDEEGVVVTRKNGYNIEMTLTQEYYDSHSTTVNKTIKVTLKGKWLPNGEQTFEVPFTLMR